MQATIKYNNIFRMIILISILLTPLLIKSQTDTIKVIISKTNNWQSLKTIQDSVAASLYKEFGYSFELDSTLKNGCINFKNEKFYKQKLPAVKGQGYLFDSYIFDYDPITWVPYTAYTEGIIRTIHEPKFADAMALFTPTKFWIEIMKVESGEYWVVISLN
jgi:hypothetical protein